MNVVSLLIVDDEYAAAALLPLSFHPHDTLPDGTPLGCHISASAEHAQAWLSGRRPATVAVAVVDLELGAASGALLIPRLRASTALRNDACIVIWSSREDGADVARLAGADAFLAKQRMGRAHAPGSDVLGIVARLWRADSGGGPRPWIVCS